MSDENEETAIVPAAPRFKGEVVDSFHYNIPSAKRLRDIVMQAFHMPEATKPTEGERDDYEIGRKMVQDWIDGFNGGPIEGKEVKE